MNRYSPVLAEFPEPLRGPAAAIFTPIIEAAKLSGLCILFFAAAEIPRRSDPSWVSLLAVLAMLASLLLAAVLVFSWAWRLFEHQVSPLDIDAIVDRRVEQELNDMAPFMIEEQDRAVAAARAAAQKEWHAAVHASLAGVLSPEQQRAVDRAFGFVPKEDVVDQDGVVT